MLLAIPNSSVGCLIQAAGEGEFADVEIHTHRSSSCWEELALRNVKQCIHTAATSPYFCGPYFFLSKLYFSEN